MATQTRESSPPAPPPAPLSDYAAKLQRHLERQRTHFDHLATQRDSWRARNSYYHDTLTKLIRFLVPEGKSVLEVGAATGDLLAAVRPSRGLGIDLSSEAIQIGQNALQRNGLEDRIELHQGDAFELCRLKEKFKRVDAATAFFVLHEFADVHHSDRLLRFLQAFRGCLLGVRFVVFETIRPSPEEMRKRPGPAIEYFLWHDLSQQTLLGRKTWKNIFWTILE